MIDLVSKARANRILALSMMNSGEVMFFPERYARSANATTYSSRDDVIELKPMFLRSSSVNPLKPVEAPVAANVTSAPLVLENVVEADLIARIAKAA